MLSPDHSDNQLYTIGEVAEELGVSRSLIRFWETEFQGLSPQKNERGERRYAQQDIQFLHQIYILVKERGFTLAGAKKELHAMQQRKVERAKMIKRLQELKFFLQKLRPD
ncbi:MAG: MerR family transcriptional regulator [Saprospiraceae bacterium]|nr:MerR family transcriptional regulator [Saprospiraceae bacterium]